MRWLVLGIVLAACGGGSDSPAIATSVTGVGSARVPRDGAAPSATTRREDLSKLPTAVPASIVIPLDAKVTSKLDDRRDADGFIASAPLAEITGPTLGSGIEVRLDDPREDGPTTADQQLADLVAELVAPDDKSEPPVTKRAPNGDWAIAFPTKGGCLAVAYAPRLHLRCGGVRTNDPCEAARAIADACMTLEAAGALVPPVRDAQRTFAPVTDPIAIETLTAAALAVVHDDRDAIALTVGPRGVRLKGKPMSRAGLRALLRTDTVQRAFELSCKPSCEWRIEDARPEDSITLVAQDAVTGVIPRLHFARDGKGAWWLSEVDLRDLGPE